MGFHSCWDGFFSAAFVYKILCRTKVEEMHLFQFKEPLRRKQKGFARHFFYLTLCTYNKSAFPARDFSLPLEIAITSFYSFITETSEWERMKTGIIKKFLLSYWNYFFRPAFVCRWTTAEWYLFSLSQSKSSRSKFRTYFKSNSCSLHTNWLFSFALNNFMKNIKKGSTFYKDLLRCVP